VLLTERTRKSALTRDRCASPGGTADHDDESLLATALREAWEETGVNPSDVEVMGEIDDNVVRSTGYVITPFVGFIPYPYSFQASESRPGHLLRSVAGADGPLRFYRQERVIDGHYYYGPVCDFDGHVIWGATGRILEHLISLLTEAAGTPAG
jgi:hypothetical protein